MTKKDIGKSIKVLIINPELRAKHMNRVEVLDRVGDLKTLPRTKYSTTKQIAEFYGVNSQAINIVIGFNRDEVSEAGVGQLTYSELKNKLFEITGSTKSWTEMRIELGIATGVTNLYPKQAVLLIGFMLEGSEIAEEVRRLAMGDNDVVTPIVAEPIQKQHNDIVVPNNQPKTTSLQIVNHSEQLVIDSRDVAEMVERSHGNVVRDIRKIVDHLGGQLKNDSSYFIETSYVNSQNKLMPCFNLTKKGCELFATRMTGAKGTLFAVQYIEQFNQMETQLKSQVTVASYMIADPIERAKQWIAEQQEKMLLETTVQEQVGVIEHKQEVIETLTEKVTIAEKRQFLNKVVRSGCGNVSYMANSRWNFLYGQFEMKHHINIRVRKENFTKKTGKKITYLDFIEKEMNMFDELYELAMKLFESEAKKIIEGYKEVLVLD